MTWNVGVHGPHRITFDWAATQQRAATLIVPPVLSRLRETAPVSATKPDAGRFKHSIGFRKNTSFSSGAGMLSIQFVSVAPYAEYVLHGTQGGQQIFPTGDVRALRWREGGSYIFSRQVVRGSTAANDFNKRVALESAALIRRAFKSSIITVIT